MKEKSEKKENAPTADADAGRTRKKPTNGTPSLIISLFYIIFLPTPRSENLTPTSASTSTERIWRCL